MVHVLDVCSENKDPDQLPHYEALLLGLQCLSMSAKWDSRP